MLLCGLPILATAQKTTTLNYNNIRLILNSKGANFYDQTKGVAGFSYPSSNNAATIYAGNIWMGGKSPNGNLRLAAETFGSSGQDYFAGPVAQTYDAAYKAKYDRFWSVTKEQIEKHKTDYKKPGYTMPEAILNWPGSDGGPDGLGYSSAPFFDNDNDGLYIPTNGDYPGIKGDFATFTFKNDIAGLHTESGSEPMNVQLNIMYYGFNSDSTYLKNTLFVSYTIINMNTQSLTNSRFGIWTDFDLGNPADDYVGSAPEKDAVYCYNGDNDDDENGGSAPGFGSNPPVQSIIFLNQTLSSAVYYSFGNGPTGDPLNPVDYYNYMSAIRRDNEPFTNPFFANGDPCKMTGETEGTNGNMPGDRRILANTSLGTIYPGQVVNIDLAYVLTRPDSANPNCAIDDSKDDMDSVKTYHKSHISDGIGSINHQEINISLYPNPTQNSIHLTIGNNLILESALIRNNLGQVILVENATDINVANLSPGLYNIEVISTSGERALRTFIKQ